MDDAKRAIERERNASEGDRELLERAYGNHLRAGGTPLEFVLESKKKIKLAEESLKNAKISAARDIEYLLCRTAERVIPKWPVEISIVELYESKDQEECRTECRTFHESAQLIKDGRLNGRIRKIEGVWLVHGKPMSFLCSEGIFNATPTLIWHKRTTHWEDILERHETHYWWIHCVGMRQQAEVMMGGLPKLRDYFEVGPSEQNAAGFPIAIEKDVRGRDIVSILNEGTLNYHIMQGNSLRNMDVQLNGKRVPCHEIYYSRAVDAFRFEAERKKKGEPSSRLIEYLIERDGKKI